MDKQKCLILKFNNKSEFFQYIQKENLKSIYYKNTLNWIMKICIHLNLDCFIYGSWRNKLEEYDMVILFDNGVKSNLTKYIKKKNRKCQIILYYWNPIMSCNKHFLRDKNIDEIWTFDLKDAKKYGLKYNPQLYTENVKIDKEIKQPQKDIIFLGKAKNRKEQILEIEQKMQNQGLRTDFIIIEKKEDFIPYYQYIEMIKHTKAILEIVNENQTGLTLRAMECMFLGKKLITNNKSIAQYDFYHEDNIFILEKKEIKSIVDFINKPMYPIRKEIIENYDYEKWLERFFK